MIDLQQNYHTNQMSHQMVCIDEGQCQSNHVSGYMDCQDLINLWGFENFY